MQASKLTNENVALLQVDKQFQKFLYDIQDMVKFSEEFPIDQDDFYFEEMRKPLQKICETENNPWNSIFQEKLLCQIFFPEKNVFSGPELPLLNIHRVYLKPVQRKMKGINTDKFLKATTQAMTVEEKHELKKAEVLVADVEVLVIEKKLAYKETVELSVLLRCPFSDYRAAAMKIFREYWLQRRNDIKLQFRYCKNDEDLDIITDMVEKIAVSKDDCTEKKEPKKSMK